MGATSRNRPSGKTLTASIDAIMDKPFRLDGATQILLQIILEDPSADFDGTFQLTVSANEVAEEALFTPVPDNVYSYKVRAQGNTQLAWLISAGSGGGIPAAMWANIKYTKAVATAGRIKNVVMSYI